MTTEIDARLIAMTTGADRERIRDLLVAEATFLKIIGRLTAAVAKTGAPSITLTLADIDTMVVSAEAAADLAVIVNGRLPEIAA